MAERQEREYWIKPATEKSYSRGTTARIVSEKRKQKQAEYAGAMRKRGPKRGSK